MTVRTFQPRSAGPITVDLAGYNANIDVVTDPTVDRARVELHTTAASGPTIDMLDKLRPQDEGDYFTLHLPKSAGGGVQINNFGGRSVISTGGSVTMTSGRGGSFISTGGGDTDMVVNGQRIQVRGGRTFVNGVPVNGGVAAGTVSEGPAPVHIRAVLPPGSKLIADTYNGNVTSTGVTRVRIKTYNGDATATGLADDSEVQSYNGEVTVGSTGGGRPTVHATTYNGDVRLLDEDMRARPQTRNGRVRYPSGS
jgi:hypothetical protein